MVLRQERLERKGYSIGFVSRFAMFIMKLLKVYYNGSMKWRRAKIGRSLKSEITGIRAALKVLYDNDMPDVSDELTK